jgi:hypothetical protein
MDNLKTLDTKSNSLDDARDYIKALAPWIKDDQIEYDSEMNPVVVSQLRYILTWKEGRNDIGFELLC